MVADSVALHAARRAGGWCSTPSTSSTATAADRGYALAVPGGGRRGRRGHAGAVRHQRRHAARRRGRIVAEVARPPARRTQGRRALPQRRRVRGGQLGGRGRGGAAARAGRGQRLRRAVRQRRPVRGHRQPGAEARPRAAAAGPARARWPRPRGPSPSWPTCRSTRASPTSGRRRSPPRRGCTPRRSPGGRTPTRTSIPAAVGNQAQVLVSELAGRSNVLAKAAELGLDLTPDPALAGRGARPGQGGRAPRLRVRGRRRLVRAAGAQSPGVLPTWFELEGYRVVIERGGREPTAARPSSGCSSATERVVAVGEGVGPVHALDQALRRALAELYPALARHPPGRLQGAHPGRPGRDQRGHPGDAHLGRRTTASGRPSGCPTTS